MKIGVLGNIANGRNVYNGQTIKTRNFIELLKLNNEVLESDTFNWKKHPFLLIKNIRKLFKNCELIVMLPAHNGVKIFVPLLLFFNKFYKKKLSYNVIGGWLPDLLNKNKLLKKMLKKFDSILVETSVMKSKLQSMGLNNIKILKNFKNIQSISKEELIIQQSIPFKFCIFSRINKKKGITDAINAIKEINKSQIKATLDIYGEIESSYNNEFLSLLNDNSSYVFYKGKCNPQDSVSVIKNYFMLLFPTKYYTEGIPGTIIDSLSSGVPIICSEWESCFDIINDDIGYTYKFDDDEQLKETINKCIVNYSEVNAKKDNCLQKSKQYNINAFNSDIVQILL